MTTAFDTRIQKRLEKVLLKHGKLITFHVLSNPEAGYNPATGIATQTPLSNPVVKCSPPLRYSLRYITSGLVKAGDVKVLLPAKGLTFVPRNGMTVTFDSTTWQIVTFDPIYAQDDVAVYTLQLRR